MRDLEHISDLVADRDLEHWFSVKNMLAEWGERSTLEWMVRCQIPAPV